MRAGLLARVSTEGQVDGMSLGAQLGAMRARCESEGWEVVREYVGEGESAFTGDVSRRPVLRALLSDASAGLFDVLLVHESSRLARHMGMASAVLERLDRAGVRLVNLQSGVDYSTAPGRLMFGVEASFNEYYSRQLGEHIKKGKRALFDAGLPVGDVPFGYRRPVDGSAKEPLLVVPLEADAIRWAFDARMGGSGYLAIAQELNRRGLRPRSKRGIGAFGVSAVQSILENGFYAGWVSYKGERRRGVHEAIVSEEVFEAAQRVVRGLSRFSRSVHLLSGLTRCASCGGQVWRVSSGYHGRYHYLREASRQRGRSCEEAGRLVRCEGVERQVEAVLLGLRLEGWWLDEVRSVAARPVEDGSRAERKRLEGVLRRARQMWVSTGDPTLERMMREAEASLSALPVGGGGQVMRLGERLEGIAEAWGLWTVGERNEALRAVFEEVRVEMGSEGVRVVPAVGMEELFGLRASVCAGVTPARNRTVERHTSGYTLVELGVAV